MGVPDQNIIFKRLSSSNELNEISKIEMLGNKEKIK